jgi:uncharacterized cupredoxin-like copper-binding protein
MNRLGTRWLTFVVAVLILTAASVAAVAAFRGGSDGGASLSLASCQPASPQGAVVQVQLTDRGSAMMGGTAMMVSLRIDQASAPGGKVTFVATNTGALNHELLVLPVPADGPGTRPVGTDGKIDEAPSLGEASKSCGAGAGDGITPGTRSWVTVDLKPGTYELLCDIPWHYADGMFGEIVIT